MKEKIKFFKNTKPMFILSTILFLLVEIFYANNMNSKLVILTINNI